MSKFIIVSIFLLSGFFLLIYTKKVKDFSGSWGWAERYFGNGGTYTALKIIGLCCIFIAFAYGTGHLEEIAGSFLGPLFGVPVKE